MELITTFILKLLDQAINTSKSIFIAKERYLLGSILNAISNFFYFIVIVRVAKSDDITTILAICLATFIGTYASGKLIRKQEGDRLYIFRATSDNLENGIKFADTIRDNNIAIHTTTGYDKSMNKTLFCEIYCTTKEESRIVTNLIPCEFKYHIQNPIDWYERSYK